MTMSNKKSVTCDECGGTGILEDDECPFCLGEGRIEVDEDETWEQSEDVEEIEDDFEELIDDEIGDEEDLY
jgi:DnaJ-class molecular chaperone